MQVLPRNDKRGAKRKRPRVEELIKISVHALVTNKSWANNLIVDREGNRLEFVDQMVGDEQRLVLYINGHKSTLSFVVVDLPIRGRLKNNQIPWDQNRTYYLLENGKRYRHLYIDPLTKKIGSRHSLNAIYTRESIGEKQKPFWRARQRILKKRRRANVFSSWREAALGSPGLKMSQPLGAHTLSPHLQTCFSCVVVSVNHNLVKGCNCGLPFF